MLNETPKQSKAKVVQPARKKSNSDMVKVLIVKYYPDNSNASMHSVQEIHARGQTCEYISQLAQQELSL
jgi:hypothetical protein